MSDPGFPKIRDSDAVPGRASNPSTTSVLLEHLLHFVREVMSTVRAYDALQKLLHVYPYGLWLRFATNMYMGQIGMPVASLKPIRSCEFAAALQSFLRRLHTGDNKMKA